MLFCKVTSDSEMIYRTLMRDFSFVCRGHRPFHPLDLFWLILALFQCPRCLMAPQTVQELTNALILV